MKRTLLPLNALRVFDAAARHLNFTRAADELAVTPAAVGQQIRALEDLLGVVLFRRTPKGLEPTAEAEAGLEPLRQGFLLFEESVHAMQQGQASGQLTIAAPTDFTALWLAPRLGAYLADNPDMKLSLVAGGSESDFVESNLDLAIWYADGPGGHEGAMIGERGLVLLGLESAPDRTLGWPGGPDAGEGALNFPDIGAALAAAKSGLGRAGVPTLLAERAATEGGLKVFGTIDDNRAYWLVAPLPQWRQAKVKALVEALAG